MAARRGATSGASSLLQTASRAPKNSVIGASTFLQSEVMQSRAELSAPMREKWDALPVVSPSAGCCFRMLTLYCECAYRCPSRSPCCGTSRSCRCKHGARSGAAISPLARRESRLRARWLPRACEFWAEPQRRRRQRTATRATVWLSFPRIARGRHSWSSSRSEPSPRYAA